MTFPTTGVIDNFNRTNEGPPPSANWTDYYGGLGVYNNLCYGSAGSQWNYSYWSASQFGADTEVYATIANTENNIELLARFNFSTVNGYSAQFINGITVRVYKIVGGTPTQLGADIDLGSTLATGDKVGMSVVGSTISIQVKRGSNAWGEVATRSDGTYTGVGNIGMGIYGIAQAMDDFGGGTVVTAGGLVIPVGMAHYRMRKN